MNIFIYGLRQPRGKIRYVGQTKDIFSAARRHKVVKTRRHLKLEVLEETPAELANERELFHFTRQRKNGGCDLNGPRFCPSNRGPVWHGNIDLIARAEQPFEFVHPTPKPLRISATA